MRDCILKPAARNSSTDVVIFPFSMHNMFSIRFPLPSCFLAGDFKHVCEIYSILDGILLRQVTYWILSSTTQHSCLIHIFCVSFLSNPTCNICFFRKLWQAGYIKVSLLLFLYGSSTKALWQFQNCSISILSILQTARLGVKKGCWKLFMVSVSCLVWCSTSQIFVQG